MMKIAKTIAMTLTVGMLCMPAIAQDAPPTENNRPRGMQGGRQMPQLPPEEAKAAWEVQAKRVASNAGLDAEKTSKVTASYIEARQSFGTSVHEAREDARERSRGLDRVEAAKEEQRVTTDVRNHEREKLQIALGKSLDADQLNKVMPLLGAFDVQWDYMVDALTEMKLEAGKHEKAMEAVDQFVLAVSKARNGGDLNAMRETSLTSRRELHATMKSLLDDQQLEKFQVALNFGRPIGQNRGPAGAGRPGGRGAEGRGGAGAGGAGTGAAPGGAGTGGEGGAGGTGTAPDDDEQAPRRGRGGRGGRGGGGGGATGGQGGGDE